MKISLRARLGSFVNGRTKEWNQASQDHKKAHPNCAFCNRKAPNEAHDKLPYLLLTDAQKHNYAWLRTNLITACSYKTYGCHRSICHCNDPNCLLYNPDVEKIAKAVQKYWSSCKS